MHFINASLPDSHRHKWGYRGTVRCTFPLHFLQNIQTLNKHTQKMQVHSTGRLSNRTGRVFILAQGSLQFSEQAVQVLLQEDTI